MEESNQALSLGFTLPSPAYIAGAFLFGLIGFAAFRYGGKTEMPVVRWLGLVLMVYPYAISQTWLMYVVGAAICALMYWFRDWGT
jgi:hypothetical protein